MALIVMIAATARFERFGAFVPYRATTLRATEEEARRERFLQEG